MKQKSKKFLVLVAEDDLDDQMLISHALESAKLAAALRFVNNGEELVGFLQNVPGNHGFSSRSEPDLIFLDLNMPRKDGREALAEIKANPLYRHIPIVVLTTSSKNEDIQLAYRLGADAYITKPESFESLRKTLGNVIRYWMETVTPRSNPLEPVGAKT